MVGELLSDLPIDVIIHILSYLDVKSIGRLACLCKKFRDAAREDIAWKNHSYQCIVSNMVSANMVAKCNPSFIPYRDRVKLSKLWPTFLGVPTIVARFEKCMPCLALKHDSLYVSMRSRISRCYRSNQGDVSSMYHEVNLGGDDIAKFVLNENDVVCGKRDGKILVLNKRDLTITQSIDAHRGDILTVDAEKDIVVSGGKDQLIKIWKSCNDERDLDCQQIIDMKIRVLCICILPTQGKFLAGTPGTNEIHPLQYIDIESGTCIERFGMSFINGGGVLDVFAHSNNTFLSCGYDAYVRLWDIRCPNSSVKEWMEPFDNSLFCVRSDYNNTIISGSSRNGSYMIFDNRVYRTRPLVTVIPKLASTYYRRMLTNYEGPVYSLEFDASHLYLGYDRSVYEFSYTTALCQTWAPSTNTKLPKIWQADI